MSAGGWSALVVVFVGVSICAFAARSEAASSIRAGSPLRDVGLAALAAAFFGTGLFLQGRAGAHVPLGLAIVAPSLMGVALIAVPMATSGRLGSPLGARYACPLLAAAELLGFLSYVIGARHSVPVAAVLSAQYATITVIIGALFLNERPGRGQLVGYFLVIVGVAAVSALQ